MEAQLIKLLLKHEFFNKVSGCLKPAMFSESLQDVFEVLVESHATYKTDISLTELKALYLKKHTLTKPARLAFLNLMDCLEDEEEPNPEIAADILADMARKNKAREIGELSARLINGDASVSLETIKAALDTEEVTNPLDRLNVVTTDVAQLLHLDSPANRFRFRLPPLQDHTRGAGRGHFAIIFARPESGKSSLAAYLVSGFLEDGLRVLYFCNEEPGHKIMLNHVRSVVSKTDLEMQADQADGKLNYTSWNSIRDNIILVDAVGMSIEEANAVVASNKPDVVVFDQLDKFSVQGSFAATHERLKEVYVKAREIAKRNSCLGIGVCQASADAEGKRELTFDMMDMSKTGKAGEADLIIGVGKDAQVEENFRRYLTLSKNKLSGWHGMITVNFDPSRCQFTP